jgi:hypothetical protein
MIHMRSADNDDVDVFRAGGWTREQLIAMDAAFVEAVRRVMLTGTAEPNKGAPVDFPDISESKTSS